jgi:TRAP-type C4-dicarboxylate transport system permease small subunit
VATIFDLYIAGEDFHVKRIGGFLGASVTADLGEEAAWEALVESNPDRFSQVANPASSLLAMMGAAAVIWDRDHNSARFWIWLAVFLVVVATIWTFSHINNARVRRVAKSSNAAHKARTSA